MNNHRNMYLIQKGVKMTTTSRNQESNIGPSVEGIARSVLFLVFFGALWASIGINGLNWLEEPWLAIVAMFIGLALLIAGVSLSRASRRGSTQAPTTNTQEGQRRSKWFRIVFSTELVAIVIAYVICRAVNRYDLFFPVMMLIVGIHFFPLASLFRIRRYYGTGTLLCLLAVLTLLVMPEHLRFSGLQINIWWVILGFGGAVILWGVGFANWIQGKRLLAKRNQ
jgi:drug/metabolite transporter (DMT)-like permease